jgi:hypothetical protein
MLTSGRAVRTARFARALALADDEQAVCFVSIGTPSQAKRGARGGAADYLAEWTTGPGCPGGPGT